MYGQHFLCAHGWNYICCYPSIIVTTYCFVCIHTQDSIPGNTTNTHMHISSHGTHKKMLLTHMHTYLVNISILLSICTFLAYHMHSWHFHTHIFISTLLTTSRSHLWWAIHSIWPWCSSHSSCTCPCTIITMSSSSVVGFPHSGDARAAPPGPWKKVQHIGKPSVVLQGSIEKREVLQLGVCC